MPLRNVHTIRDIPPSSFPTKRGWGKKVPSIAHKAYLDTLGAFFGPLLVLSSGGKSEPRSRQVIRRAGMLVTLAAYVYLSVAVDPSFFTETEAMETFPFMVYVVGILTVLDVCVVTWCLGQIGSASAMGGYRTVGLWSWRRKWVS